MTNGIQTMLVDVLCSLLSINNNHYAVSFNDHLKLEPLTWRDQRISDNHDGHTVDTRTKAPGSVLIPMRAVDLSLIAVGPPRIVRRASELGRRTHEDPTVTPVVDAG